MVTRLMFTQTVTRALSRFGLDQRGTDPFPRQPKPMLLQKANAMISSSDWTYEPKWDGFRILGLYPGRPCEAHLPQRPLVYEPLRTSL